MALRDRRDDDRGRDRDRDDRREERGRDRESNRDRDRGRDDDRGRGRDRDRGGRRSYSHHNAENVRKHSEQTGGSGDGIFKSGTDSFRAKDGENCVRILPPTWEGYEHYGLEVYVHSYIGASGSTYLCPIKMGYGNKCAACEESAELRAAGEEDDAIRMAVKKNYVYYILDRDDRKPWPKLWRVGWRQDQEIADAALVKRKNTVKYIDDPEVGYDVFVKRTGKQRNTRYTYQIDSDSSPIDTDPDKQDDIIAHIEDNPIPGLLKEVSNEKIASDLEGMTRKRDGGDDDDERGGTRRGRGRDRDEDRGSRREERGRDRDEDRGGSRRRDRDEGGDEEDTRSPRGDRDRGRDRDEDRGDDRRRGRDDDGETGSRDRGERDGRSERQARREPEDDRGSRRSRDPDEDRGSRRRDEPDEERGSSRRRDRDDDDRPRRRD